MTYIVARKKNCIHDLYYELNNDHLNVNLTIEINPKTFLDTQVITKIEKLKLLFIENKLLVPCSSNIPKGYKVNVINADF